MKVRALIAELSKVDPELDVLFEAEEEGMLTTVSVEQEPTCDDDSVCRVYLQM